MMVKSSKCDVMDGLRNLVWSVVGGRRPVLGVRCMGDDGGGWEFMGLMPDVPTCDVG